MPKLLPTDARRIGDVIAPFVKDGVFTADFYMVDRVGAMKGASVAEYQHAHLILGAGGWENLHTHVLMADEPGKLWHESMTTSADCGWNPRGQSYYWVPQLNDQQNAANWIACGRPRRNQFGAWGNNGVPIESDEYGTMSVDERVAAYGNTSPMYSARGGRGGKRRR